MTFGHLGEGVDPLISAVVEGGQGEAVAVLDSGQEDGVRKVVIGGRSQDALRLWFVRLLVLDCLDHLSSGRIQLPLTRYLMVDIDDIFTGTARLLQEDVLAMLESQARIARTVTDFRYNLGFSGKTFLQVGLSSTVSGERLWLQGEAASQTHSFRDAEQHPVIPLNVKKKLWNIFKAAQTRHRYQPVHHRPLSTRQ